MNRKLEPHPARGAVWRRRPEMTQLSLFHSHRPAPVPTPTPNRHPIIPAWLLTAVLLCLFAASALAQAVLVTTTLDTNRIVAGGSTVWRVFAQIAPSHTTNSLQIFSWHVDLLLQGAGFAELDAAGLRRTTSDNDPLTSSSGFTDGSSRRGIQDTFLLRPGAGKEQPIELLSIPVRGLAPGQVSLYVQAGTNTGTGASGTVPDFIVEPSGTGSPLSGGDYRVAQAVLEVLAPATNLVASIRRTPLPAGRGDLITIHFPPIPGRSHVVEHTQNPGAQPQWSALPGAPHNIGYADDTNNTPMRFYRIRITD